MKRHWSYLKYIVRHKWFVFIAALKIGAPIWSAIIHDWSKLLPSEWGPYARTFYKPDGSKQYVETQAFDKAWNYHQKRNKHHWQFWLLRMDDGRVINIEMPPKYVLEMVADWMGAGRAITGKWEAQVWYLSNRDKIAIHTRTRVFAEKLLNIDQ